MSKNPKNWWKLANIDREFFHIFWMTWGNSIKFSGKMCLKIILKVTEKQGFTLSLEDTFFGKPQGRSVDPPAVLGLMLWYFFSSYQVTKLQSFESGMSDVITTNVKNISPLSFLHIFVNFVQKEILLHSFMINLTISH